MSPVYTISGNAIGSLPPWGQPLLKVGFKSCHLNNLQVIGVFSTGAVGALAPVILGQSITVTAH